MSESPAPPNEQTHSEEEEPVTTGTVFLTLVLLMLIFGFWVMMYLVLLGR